MEDLGNLCSERIQEFGLTMIGLAINMGDEDDDDDENREICYQQLTVFCFV